MSSLKKYRYEEFEINYKKYLEFKSGNVVVEKEFFQLQQIRSVFEIVLSFFDLGDFKKALEYVDKVVFVFFFVCLKVVIFIDIVYFLV